jgi:hypothetical protein
MFEFLFPSTTGVCGVVGLLLGVQYFRDARTQEAAECDWVGVTW